MARHPRASIVIPTHDRRASVEATLEALDAQDVESGAFEVIVVANACTDDTVARLHARRTSFALRVLDLPAPGASLARNAGAAAAASPLVVFLDDDIRPHPGFVSAHLRAHGMRADGSDGPAAGRVVIGYLPAVLQPEQDRFAIALRGWWEAMFDRMRDPGHRFGYTDLLSGNCSVSREQFLSTGGFDETLRCHEDYELGVRLIDAGAQFVFAEDAWGVHADHTRVDRACARKRDEGVADVQIAKRHPHLRPVLPLVRPPSPRQRLYRWLAFNWPAAGDRLAAALISSLGVFERTGASATWLRVLYAAFGYWYARGLADGLGSEAALGELLAGAAPYVTAQPNPPGALRIDITEGLSASLCKVDEVRPRAVVVVGGPQWLASLPDKPGAERLAARHVVAELVQRRHETTFRALVEAGLAGFDALGRSAVRRARPANEAQPPLAGPQPPAETPALDPLDPAPVR